MTVIKRQKNNVKRFIQENIIEVFLANLETLITTITSLLFLAVLSNASDKYLFGEFNYFLTVLMFFNIFVIFGSDNVLLETDNIIKEYKKNFDVFWFRLFNLLILGFLLIIISGFNWFYIFFIVSPFLVLSEKNRINRRNKRMFKGKIIFVLLSASLKISIAYFGYHSFLKLAILLEFSYGVFLFSPKLLKKSYFPSINSYQEILRRSWPYALSSISVILYSRLDQIIIPQVLNYEELASYSVAIRIGDSLNFILVTTAVVLARKYMLLGVNIGRLYLVSLALAITLLILLLVSGPYIIKMLFTNYYNTSVLRLFWLQLLNLPLVAIGLVQTKFLTVNKMSKLLPFRFFLGAVINLLGTVLLLPLTGLDGAVYSTLLAQVIVNLIYPYLNSKLSLLRFG